MERPTLSTITPKDYDFIFGLMTHPSQLTRGRLRGATPSPESLHRFLWDSVLSQFLVTDDSGPLGIVTSYGADFRHGTAYVAVYASEVTRGSGLVLLALADFIDYLFRVFPLRKLYADVLEENLGQFGNSSGFYSVEGVLRQHEFVDGRYSDLYVLAVYRELWEKRRKAVKDFATASGSRTM